MLWAVSTFFPALFKHVACVPLLIAEIKIAGLVMEAGSSNANSTLVYGKKPDPLKV